MERFLLRARNSGFLMVAVGLLLRLGSVAYQYRYHLNPALDHWRFGWEMGRVGRAIFEGHGFAPVCRYTPPPIFPGKNLKIKGLNRNQSHVRLYFQYSKFEEVFPYFGENSMLCGIIWLSGIGENFRLTVRDSAGFRGGEGAKLRRKVGFGDTVTLEPL
jgi:hypothetical protein